MSLIGYLLQLAVNAGAFLLIARLLPGFTVKRKETAFVMAFVYSLLAGIANKLAEVFLLSVLVSAVGMMVTIPILGWIAGALLLVSLPLLTLVVSFASAILVLVVTDEVIEDFEMDSMATTVIAAAMLGLVGGVGRWMLKLLLGF
ncbi:MAG: phage holin family protein [Candidatus Wallbacteria bacterium]|nr:phage holin family protein [Candidatus Wallbacteria bacterium]